MQRKEVTEIQCRDVEERKKMHWRQSKGRCEASSTWGASSIRWEIVDDIFRALYHNNQSEIRSVLYYIVEQVKLGLLEPLHKDVMSKTLEVHIAKFFEISAAADRLWKKFMKSSSFMAPIATFVPRKTDCAKADQNTLIAKASKREPVVATEAYGDNIEEAPSWSDSGIEETHRSRSSRRQ